MKRYNSKIGVGLLSFILILVGSFSIFFAYEQEWLGFTINTLTLAFVVHLFTSTYYVIDGNKLNIKSGFLINIDVDIKSIRQIKKSTSILSSPAASFDRIEVFFNKYDSVLISPKDKKEFISELQNINNSIEVSV